MLARRFAQRAKNDALLGELFFVGRGDGNRIEDRVDSNACKTRTFIERDAQLLVSFQKFRIHFIQRLRCVRWIFGG